MSELNTPADQKINPMKMREYKETVTTSSVAYQFCPSGHKINSLLIESEEELYIGLGNDSITDHTGGSDPEQDALRLNHSGGGSSKFYIQEEEFYDVYIAAITTGTTITVTPGRRTQV